MNVKRVLDSLNLDQIRTDLATHYHTDGPGRTPINPLSMLKAQLTKHLLNIISDRRLSLRLKHDHKVARACEFRRHTPSNGLFTHFRHRLGEETYHKVFNRLTRILIESGTIIGKVLAVDSTHLKAFSGRAMDLCGEEAGKRCLGTCSGVFDGFRQVFSLFWLLLGCLEWVLGGVDGFWVSLMLA